MAKERLSRSARRLRVGGLSAAFGLAAIVAVWFSLRDSTGPSDVLKSEARAEIAERRIDRASNRGIGHRFVDSASSIDVPRPYAGGWYVKDGHRHISELDDAPNVMDGPPFEALGRWTGTDLEIHKAMRECFAAAAPMSQPCDYSLHFGFDEVAVDGDGDDDDGLASEVTLAKTIMPERVERGCAQFAECAALSYVGRRLAHIDQAPSSTSVVHDFKVFPPDGTLEQRRARAERQLKAYYDELEEWQAANPDAAVTPPEIDDLLAFIRKLEWDLENIL